MIEFLRLPLHIMASFFKPRTKLVAEILILRQQLNVLRRQVSKRPQLSNTDRFLFVWLYRWFPSVLSAIAILRPETIIRWHRTGFRSYWRERSRKPVGRPRISAERVGFLGITIGKPRNGCGKLRCKVPTQRCPRWSEMGHDRSSSDVGSMSGSLESG